MRLSSLPFLTLFVFTSGLYADERHLPPEEAAALWKTAARFQEVQVNRVKSLEAKYTFSMRGDANRRVQFEAELAVEGGAMLRPDRFAGKSYQRIRMRQEGDEQEYVVEAASQGGTQGVRTREPGGHLRDGGTCRTHCELPHTAAEYPVIDSLLHYKPSPKLISGARLDSGLVRFTFVTADGTAKLNFDCDPASAYMPRRIETLLAPSVESQEFTLAKVTQVNYSAVKSPDASVWYYPTSGKSFKYNTGSEVLHYEWEVDTSTLRVNADIPDTRFRLEPEPGKAVIRASDFKVIQEPVGVARNASPPAIPQATAKVMDQPVRQEVFGGGTNWWQIGGVTLGLVVALTGAVVLFYRRK